jgi:hypothetical protein
MNKNNPHQMNKSAIEVTALSAQRHDRDYWLSRTVNERFEAIELMRQINYDYDPSAGRLQRVLEIVELH